MTFQTNFKQEQFRKQEEQITLKYSGTSANAGPHYQKLYARVTHIWGNRRGQPNRSAMRGPHPERTAFVITVASRVR